MSTEQTRRPSNRSEYLARLLETLPSSDEFIRRIKELESNEAHERYIIPYLKELHEVVYEFLPKPNKGLWEPKLGLDHFLLSYYTLAYQNYEYQQKLKQQKEKESQQEDQNNDKNDGRNNEEIRETESQRATPSNGRFIKSKL